ncbi:hypothetical protein M8745_18450, partial [Lutimaribacter sp. EGI FJ00014]|nr:hypothetical protein [Lutimaribacter sp. EGI FJ00014]
DILVGQNLPLGLIRLQNNRTVVEASTGQALIVRNIQEPTDPGTPFAIDNRIELQNQSETITGVIGHRNSRNFTLLSNTLDGAMELIGRDSTGERVMVDASPSRIILNTAGLSSLQTQDATANLSSVQIRTRANDLIDAGFATFPIILNPGTITIGPEHAQLLLRFSQTTAVTVTFALDPALPRGAWGLIHSPLMTGTLTLQAGTGVSLIRLNNTASAGGDNTITVFANRALRWIKVLNDAFDIIGEGIT